MKVIHATNDPRAKVAVGDMPAGSVFLNGEHNVCMTMKRTMDDHATGKVRLVNLENGGSYMVQATCQYEPIEATLTWTYKCAGCSQ